MCGEAGEDRDHALRGAIRRLGEGEPEPCRGGGGAGGERPCVAGGSATRRRVRMAWSTGGSARRHPAARPRTSSSACARCTSRTIEASRSSIYTRSWSSATATSSATPRPDSACKRPVRCRRRRGGAPIGASAPAGRCAACSCTRTARSTPGSPTSRRAGAGEVAPARDRAAASRDRRLGGHLDRRAAARRGDPLDGSCHGGGGKLSKDPAFATKLRDIVGLYVDPPAHAVVLSADEKSQVQALDRSQPGLPIKPGRLGTMTTITSATAPPPCSPP